MRTAVPLARVPRPRPRIAATGADFAWLYAVEGGQETPRQPVLVVPTLEDLRRDPTIFETLPAPTQAALYAHVAVLEARLRAALLAPRSAAVVSTPERAVRIEAAADLLAMSPDFLYRHWAKFGGYKDLDGHVKFAVSMIQRHIAPRDGDGGPSA